MQQPNHSNTSDQNGKDHGSFHGFHSTHGTSGAEVTHSISSGQTIRSIRTGFIWTRAPDSVNYVKRTIPLYEATRTIQGKHWSIETPLWGTGNRFCIAFLDSDGEWKRGNIVLPEDQIDVEGLQILLMTAPGPEFWTPDEFYVGTVRAALAEWILEEQQVFRSRRQQLLRGEIPLGSAHDRGLPDFQSSAPTNNLTIGYPAVSFGEEARPPTSNIGPQVEIQGAPAYSHTDAPMQGSIQSIDQSDISDVEESIERFSKNPRPILTFKITLSKYGMRWLIITPWNGPGQKFEIRTQVSSAVDCAIWTMELPKYCRLRKEVAVQLPRTDNRKFWPTSEFGSDPVGQVTMRGILIDMIDALRQKCGLQPLERDRTR